MQVRLETAALRACWFLALGGILLWARGVHASCGMGNACATAVVTVAADPATAGGQDTISCDASDSDGTVTQIVLEVTGGSFVEGTSPLTVVVDPPATPVTATATWLVPNTPGTSYTVTCTPWDNGGFMGVPTAGTPDSRVVSVEAAPEPPAVDSLSAGSQFLFPGESTTLVAAAHDPAGGALTYAWSATAGTISGDQDGDPQRVDYVAPPDAGPVTISLTVTSTSGQTAVSSLSVSVVLAKPDSSFVAPTEAGFAPARLARDAAGNIYVSDPRARAVFVLSPRGYALRRVSVGAAPAGVAPSSDGLLWVGDLERGEVVAYDALGQPAASLGAGAGELVTPLAIAISDTTGDIYVADGAAGAVKVYAADGSFTRAIPTAGAYPIGVALDAGTGDLYVSNAKGGEVRVYDATGNLLRTYGTFGAGPGQLTRAAGVALGADGRVYVVDSFQSRVAVFAPSGTFLAFIGTWGGTPGTLSLPVDLVLDGSARLIVTSAGTSRIESFALAAAPPIVCAGDADCDGMPDAWELAHGFDPYDPSDAYGDADGDGLANVLEYQHGTEPRNSDTDGDGVSDGAEVLAGANPLDPWDQRPTARVEVASPARPGRILLDATTSSDPNGDALTFSWTQDSGPDTATVVDAGGGRATVVLRRAGAYDFSVRVSDGKGTSEPAQAHVEILNLAPTADAGPAAGVALGAAVTLDGRMSRDANADAPRFAWAQVVGPSVTLSDAAGAMPQLTPDVPGLYRFELLTSDATLTSEPDTVSVLVHGPTAHVPGAVVPALTLGNVGSPVIVKGGSSADSDGDLLTYDWVQLEGPPVATDLQAAILAFVPDAPGAYAFSLRVSDGALTSDDAVARVAVTAAGQSVPVAEAGPDRRVRVLDTVTLSCAGAPDCRWAQVLGAPVALVPSGSDVAFVPIDAGTYAFELTLADAAGASTSDRMFVVVDDPAGNHVPEAVAAIGGSGMVGEAVLLDATGSHDEDLGTTLGFAWTQVAGAPLVIDGARAAMAAATPTVPGWYEFELRVDDGLDRSAPARVGMTVALPYDAPPVAIAGSDRLVAGGAEVVLDGSGSYDPEGAPLGYAWQQLGGPPAAVVGGLGAAELRLVAGPTGFTMRFSLTVTDGGVSSDPDTVYVSIVDRAFSLTDLVPNEAATVTVSARGSSLDGTVVRVPAAAVQAPVQLALGAVTRPWYTAPGREAYGEALLLGPSGELLAAPLDLVMTFDAEPLLRRGVRPEDLSLVRYDQQASAWLPLAATVDLVHGTALASVRELGVVQLTVPEGWTSLPVVSPPRKGCAATSPSLAPAALAALALLLLRRRRTATLLAAVLGIALARPASATDAPHDVATLGNGCNDCHLAHNALGAALTNQAGIANLCMACHTGGQSAAALPFASADQAVIGTSGTSHSWSGNATNAAVGAAPPTDPEMAKRVVNGAITCSACHDEHSEAFAPFDPTAPATPGAAGRHFMRIANNAGQMCVDCHAAWNTSAAVGNGAWTGNALTHQVGVPIPSADPTFNATPRETDGTTQVAATFGTASGGTTTSLTVSGSPWAAGALVGQWVRFTSGANRNVTRQISSNGTSSIAWASAVPQAIAPGVGFEIDRDGNVTNNVVLDNGGAASFTTGNVVCLSCHGVHYADSSSSSYDSPTTVGTGDGRLLRRSANDDACTGCHAVFTHNSTNTGSTRPAWGSSFNCLTCHTPHATKNIELVKQSIATPNNGSRTVDFRNMNTGIESYGLVNSTTPGTGPCETCHTDTRNGAEYTTGTATFTAGSTTVTCSPTNTCGWTASLASWEVKRTADGPLAWTKITGVPSSNQLTLAAGYKGTSGTSATYQAANPRFRNTGSGRGAAGTEHYSGTCTTCHTHAGGFKAGESQGNTPCGSCHDFDMDVTDSARTTKYHHVMEIDAAMSAGVTVYPTSATPTVASGDQDKSCVQCHADHGIFRPTNTSNDLGRGANLRSRIGNGPTTTPPAAPGDVAPGYYTNADANPAFAAGGICLSCHTSAQTKNTTDQKSSASTGTGTAAMVAADFAASAHAYGVSGRIKTDAGTFTVACTKCHNDDGAHGYQDGTWTFSLHGSFDRRLRGALGITSPSDPLEEKFCFRCHSLSTDANPGGGPAKGTADADYYGTASMSAGSQGIFAEISSIAAPPSAPSGHDVRDYSGLHRTQDAEGLASNDGTLSGANRHVECEDCHDPHAAGKAGDSGTATAGTATTLTDSSKTSWRANQWVGYSVIITSGTGAGQAQNITASTATGQLTVASWSAAAGTPAGGSAYRITRQGSNRVSGATTGVRGITVTPTISYSQGTATFVDAALYPSESSTTVHSGAGGGIVVANSTGTTLSIANRLWAANALAGYTLRMVTGASKNQTRSITGNTVSTTSTRTPQAITFSGTGLTVAAGDLFVVYDTTGSPRNAVWSSSMVGGFIRNELDRNGRWYRITGFSQPTAGSDYYQLTITPAYASTGASALSDTKIVGGTTAPLGKWQMDAGTLYSVSAATLAPTAAASYEYQICLECHSSWAYGDTPPAVPSGHLSGTSAVAQTNVAMDFNSGQLSYHPIFAQGKNQPTTVTNSAWGTNQPFTRIDNTGSSSTFGLSNTFTTGWYKESLLRCSDCHASDTPSDPLGPHASGKKWILKGLDQSVCWTRRNSGGTGWETICNSSVPSTPAVEAKNYCLNCHRWDVYGYAGLAGDAPAAGLSRVPHDVTGNNNTYKDTLLPASGIVCNHCHGGDRLAGAHGSNRRKFPYGYDPSDAAVITASPGSYSGKRLLNGAYWFGVTRATTSSPVACWGKAGTDTVSLCAHGHEGTGGNPANYSYDDAADP